MLRNYTVKAREKENNVENSHTWVYINIILQFGFMNIPGVLCREKEYGRVQGFLRY